ncbi:C-C motif chemokine 20 isoform X2 [Larimichthys crocea]|uniref:C-C motif chemokine 20 isoform X2 n=1 Tax=Larimichthys crocea TaxID=215358 RepID=UPI00054B214E|nr:C-C motif chemokine 20 isoform X2 [Larimichthys crocea]
MAPSGILIVTTALLCILLGLLTPAPAARSPWSKSCCTRYFRKPIRFQHIKGYREQTLWENCRIKAIVLLTVWKQEICVNPDDKWVKKILKLLSSKLSKMSKDGSAAGETHTKKGVTHAFNDGSGSFSTTETYPNITESFD